MIKKRMAWMLAMLLIATLLYLQPMVTNALAEGALTVESAYPSLATGVLQSAVLAEMDKGTLLKGDGVEVQASFADKTLGQVKPEIRKQLEKSMFFLLEQEAVRELIRQDAMTMGISMDQSEKEVGKNYVDRLTKRVKTNEAEVRAFYDKNKGMLGGMPFDQVKENIEKFLLYQKKQGFMDAHIKVLGKKSHIRLNRDWVKKQSRLALDNPVDQARISGKPTMAEFGASGCVPCDMMQPVLERLRKKYPDQLNVVFVQVRENQLLAARFGIRAIPVQVFYDAKGKEVFRHNGFYAEEDVVKQLKKLGVE